MTWPRPFHHLRNPHVESVRFLHLKLFHAWSVCFYFNGDPAVGVLPFCTISRVLMQYALICRKQIHETVLDSDAWLWCVLYDLERLYLGSAQDAWKPKWSFQLNCLVCGAVCRFQTDVPFSNAKTGYQELRPSPFTLLTPWLIQTPLRDWYSLAGGNVTLSIIV